MSSVFDLSGQYNFYKKYHKNPINVLIHVVCIPLIVWSFCVLLTPIVVFSAKFNLTFIISCLYSFYYIILNYNLGKFMVSFMMMCWFTSYLFYYNTKGPLFYGLLINIFSWIMQFIGHGIFEGKKPALMDSLIQAFLIAPMFVLIDILKWIGYKDIF